MPPTHRWQPTSFEQPPKTTIDSKNNEFIICARCLQQRRTPHDRSCVLFRPTPHISNAAPFPRTCADFFPRARAPGAANVPSMLRLRDQTFKRRALTRHTLFYESKTNVSTGYPPWCRNPQFSPVRTPEFRCPSAPVNPFSPAPAFFLGWRREEPGVCRELPESRAFPHPPRNLEGTPTASSSFFPQQTGSASFPFPECIFFSHTLSGCGCCDTMAPFACFLCTLHSGGMRGHPVLFSCPVRSLAAG